MIHIVFLDGQNTGTARATLLHISLSNADEKSLLEKHTAELSGFTRVITPFTKGRMTLPVGTLILKQSTSSVKYFTNSSLFQDMVAIATLGNLLRRAKKLPIDERETTYFNLSSLKLIHTANNNLELFTGDSDCLDALLRRWEATDDSSLNQEINDGFKDQLAYLQQISAKKGMPLAAFQQDKIEISISSHLENVFPTLVSVILGLDPAKASFVYNAVGGNGNYYQRYVKKIDDVLKSPGRDIGLVNPSDSPDQQDTFPSVGFLAGIQGFVIGKRQDTIKKLQEHSHKVMKKLCTWYVLREMLELIALKADAASRVIATKYANPYNKDIIISICLIGIAKLGDLGNFLSAAYSRDCTSGLEMLTADNAPSAEDASFINNHLGGTNSILTSKPIFRQFLEFLTGEDELLHEFKTGGTKKGFAAKAQINAPKASEFIIALCANEVFGKSPDEFMPRSPQISPVLIRKLDVGAPFEGPIGNLYSRLCSAAVPTAAGAVVHQTSRGL